MGRAGPIQSQEPGTFGISHVGSGAQAIRVSSIAVPGPLSGCWAGSGTATTQTGTVWDTSTTASGFTQYCHSSGPSTDEASMFAAVFFHDLRILLVNCCGLSIYVLELICRDASVMAVGAGSWEVTWLCGRPLKKRCVLS